MIFLIVEFWNTLLKYFLHHRQILFSNDHILVSDRRTDGLINIFRAFLVKHGQHLTENYNLESGTKICSGNRIKFIILKISFDQIIKTKRRSWSYRWLVKRRVSDPILQFIPTDIVQKNFAFFEHVHNSHRTDIFYHCDSCCHKLDLCGVEILKR